MIASHSRRFYKHLLIFIVIVSACFCRPAQADTTPELRVARVIAVNDGDTVTVRMNGNEVRTRLIGLDAPESGQEPWGPKAHEHLRNILKELHWQVSIETDFEQRDKYNRLLVYLWSGKTLINEQMLLDGYAVLFTMQPNSKYVDRFRKAQRFAREKKLGIWGPDGLKERPLDYKKKHPRERR